MTDEELAEEYADWFWGASPSEQRAIKQAYLAGVKAGRPQWHKVADGDLPSNDRYVWTNVGACYYDEAGWWDDFGRLQDVIAWCEPKFKE